MQTRKTVSGGSAPHESYPLKKNRLVVHGASGAGQKCWGSTITELRDRLGCEPRWVRKIPQSSSAGLGGLRAQGASWPILCLFFLSFFQPRLQGRCLPSRGATACPSVSVVQRGVRHIRTGF